MGTQTGRQVAWTLAFLALATLGVRRSLRIRPLDRCAATLYADGSMRRRKARSLYRQLGLTHSTEPPERRGLVLLQVDALSYFALRASLNRRYLPFLSKLIRRGGYRLHAYQTGLPATTPAFQLGLFYGSNDHVAGFRWLDKRRQRVMNVKRPEDAADAEQESAARAPGLLAGGSCHCSIVGGGAEHSSLVLARVGTETPKEPRTWAGLLALVLLDIWLVVRLIGATLLEAFIELAEGIKAEYEGRMVRGEWPFLLVRVLTNIVFREIAARNVMIDMARGMPVIYANFAGYDELAHHRGPVSLSARLALRGIDARLRQIFRAARRYGERPYDLYVFSDHGQVPTIPFERLVGRTLEDELAMHLLDAREMPPGVTDAEVARLRTLVAVQRELEQIVPRRLAWLPRRLASYIESQLPPDPEAKSYREYSEVALLPTSDLCHVYVTSVAEPLTLDEFRVRDPKLWKLLLEHPAIWAVVGRGREEEGERIAEVSTARGAAFIRPNGQYRRVGQDPFAAADFPEGVAQAIHRFAWSKNAGDAVLIGAKIHGHAVNFQEEFGGHGGPYPEEQMAFMLSPPSCEEDFSTVRHHSELYAYFHSRYRT